ncbi:MAG: ATP-dependent DNA helicase RecG [Candidatus Gastranaerophilales bacterium]|nr:ATP-dependent DNA helicase RecG [Candidatus Gastranaerophilales bacterium]
MQIKKAVEIEKSKQYIDTQGRKTSFSNFILQKLFELRQHLSKAEKIRLDGLISAFEQYPFDSLDSRMKSIDLLIETFIKYKAKTAPKKEIQRKSQNFTLSKTSDVCYVKGVGPVLAEIFKKIGIRTVSDLIEYYPKKYIDYKGISRIGKIREGENVSILGQILKSTIYQTKTGLTVHTVTIGDNTGKIKINYFYKIKGRKMIEHYRARYPENALCIANGTVKFDPYLHSYTLIRPEIELIEEYSENEEYTKGKIISVYPLCENLNSKTLVRAIKNALSMYDCILEDILPDEIIAKRKLLPYREAINKIHFPENNEDIERAHFRIVYEEVFIMQLGLALLREETKKLNSVVLDVKKDGLVNKFVKSLPFELTDSQKKAFSEILNDIKSPRPMQRLLQGDVGSGKTVVACMVLLSAIENGYQGAIMAPTEILAVQHYRNFVQKLMPMGVSVGLFLGKNSAKVRKSMLSSLKNGQMNIAVGTHALIQNEVKFNNLGAVVIDEQHRFGVNQRMRLFSKGKCPQTLTMTATPIPRTLALTVHGDLDVTIIDEMPKGRLPVKTSLLSGGQAKCAYDKLKEEIAKKHQGYIVYPLIDESETISAKNATEQWEKLSKTIFQGYKIGLLHGKLKAEEKDTVMNDFKNKKYDILVCTTVVEVGVDVPDASVMIIENAERFGLSQIHQLRGRVGRSDIQSYCFLITGHVSKSTKEKLSVLEETNNGFVIAQKDLEIRGPGEFSGIRQSGIAEFMLFDFVKDVKILELARKDAFEFIEKNNIDNFPKLKALAKEKNLFKS